MAFTIYTRTGDTGETSLYGGRRTAKDDVRVEAYGTVDELNASLGLLHAEFDVTPLPGLDLSRERAVLLTQQERLFTLGSELATPPDAPLAVEPLTGAAVDALEREIDALEEGLPPLSSFILPGGSRPSALAHSARTLARRAERRVVSLHRDEPVREVVIRYLNRLSDYLFVLARALNHVAGTPDVPWAPRSSERP